MQCRFLLHLGFVAALSLFCACSGKTDEKPDYGNPPAADAGLAMRFVQEQLAFGERPAGSVQAEKTAEWVCRAAGKNARIDTFSDRTPEGEKTFRNVICTIPGKTKRFVIVGAHYDTKKLSVSEPFFGANDGASGVAALLAMIRAFPDENPLPFGLRFVFFDGEECLNSYSATDGLHGSRHDSASLVASGEAKDCVAMILLDMIGDRDLQVRFPSDTDPHLLKLAESVSAEQPFFGKFISGGHAMLDDHIPYQKIGIPSLDLIDFSYGPDNMYWHTPCDTADRVSGESMALAADFAFKLIWKLASEEKRQ